MFQLRRGGGGFAINIGQSGPEGIREGPWAELPVEKLTVGYLSARSRISTGFWSNSTWFEFGPQNYDDPRPARRPSSTVASPRRPLAASTKRRSLGSQSRALAEAENKDGTSLALPSTDRFHLDAAAGQMPFS